MSSIRIENFDPHGHAKDGFAPYPQTGVVTGPAPLTELDFSPPYALAPQTSSIEPKKECPQFGTLEAHPRVPVIGGDESRQQLKVFCPERRGVKGKDPHTYGVCALRALDVFGENGVKKVPLNHLTNPTLYSLIQCPFRSLGAAATGKPGIFRRPVTVHVTVTAVNPQNRESLPHAKNTE